MNIQKVILPEYIGFGINSIQLFIKLENEEIENTSIFVFYRLSPHLGYVEDTNRDVVSPSVFVMKQEQQELHLLVQLKVFEIQQIPVFIKVALNCSFNTGTVFQYESPDIPFQLQKSNAPIIFEHKTPTISSIKEKVIQKTKVNSKQIEVVEYRLDPTRVFEQEFNVPNIYPREKIDFDCFGGISYKDDYYLSSILSSVSNNKVYHLFRNSLETEQFREEFTFFKSAEVILREYSSSSSSIPIFSYTIRGHIISVLNSNVCIFVQGSGYASTNPTLIPTTITELYNLYTSNTSSSTTYTLSLRLLDGLFLDEEEEIEEKRLSVLSLIMQKLSTLSGIIYKVVLYGKPRFRKEDWRILSSSTIRRNILQVNQTIYQTNGFIPDKVRIADIGNFKNIIHLTEFYTIEYPNNNQNLISFQFNTNIFFKSIEITPSDSASVYPLTTTFTSKDKFYLFENQEIEVELSLLLKNAKVELYFVSDDAEGIQEEFLVKEFSTDEETPEVLIRRAVFPILILQQSRYRRFKIKTTLFNSGSKIILAGIKAIQTEFSNSAYFEFPISIPYRNEVIDLKLEFLNPYSQSNEVEYELGSYLITGENFYVTGEDSFIDGRVFIGTDYDNNIEIGSSGSSSSYIKSNRYYGREEFASVKETPGYLIWSKSATPTLLNDAYRPVRKIKFTDNTDKRYVFSFYDPENVHNTQNKLANYLNVHYLTSFPTIRPVVEFDYRDAFIRTRDKIRIKFNSDIEFGGNFKLFYSSSSSSPSSSPTLYVKETSQQDKITVTKGSIILYPEEISTSDSASELKKSIVSIKEKEFDITVTPVNSTLNFPLQSYLLRIEAEKLFDGIYLTTENLPPSSKMNFSVDKLFAGIISSSSNTSELYVITKENSGDKIPLYCASSGSVIGNTHTDLNSLFDNLKNNIEVNNSNLSISVDGSDFFNIEDIAIISKDKKFAEVYDIDFPKTSSSSPAPSNFHNSNFCSLKLMGNEDYEMRTFVEYTSPEQSTSSLIDFSWASDIISSSGPASKSWYRINKSQFVEVNNTRNRADTFFYYPAEYLFLNVKFDLSPKPKYKVEKLSIEGFLNENLILEGVFELDSQNPNENYEIKYTDFSYWVSSNSSNDIYLISYIDWNFNTNRNYLFRGQSQRLNFTKNTYIKIKNFSGFILSNEISLSNFFPSQLYPRKITSTTPTNYQLTGIKGTISSSSDSEKPTLFEFSNSEQLSNIKLLFSLEYSFSPFKMYYLWSEKYVDTSGENLISSPSTYFNLVAYKESSSSVS